MTGRLLVPVDAYMLLERDGKVLMLRRHLVPFMRPAGTAGAPVRALAAGEDEHLGRPADRPRPALAQRCQLGGVGFLGPAVAVATVTRRRHR